MIFNFDVYWNNEMDLIVVWMDYLFGVIFDLMGFVLEFLDVVEFWEKCFIEFEVWFD